MYDLAKKLEEVQVNEKKMNWHLFWTAAGTVLSLAAIIVGSYVSLLCRIGDLSKEIALVQADLSLEISDVRNEIVKIQTILILKGIAPKDLFSALEEQ